MFYVKQDKPVTFEYQNSSVKTIKTATLETNTSAPLTQVEPLDCTGCETTTWVAVFDPHYFSETNEYQIRWVGTDVNDLPFEELETGITVKYSQDFYSGFLKFLRQSIFDDSNTCDYPPDTLINAVNYANCLINNQPPFTDCPPDSQPCSILLDLSKAYLYKSRAGREAGETFTYNDIGKSFSFDVSSKLIQIAESLERNALDLLRMYKKNLRPQMKGLGSRYARRSGRGARAMFIERNIYRNFIR